MRLLSSFKHFYYSLDFNMGFLLCFWVRQFFSNLHISAKICKNSADLHISAKIENLGLRKRLLDNQPLPWWPFKTFQSTKSVKNLTKNAGNFRKMEKFKTFVIFGVNLIFFFIWETAIISSENPTGQRNISMLRIFNILIHDIYRNIDNNCIET